MIKSGFYTGIIGGFFGNNRHLFAAVLTNLDPNDTPMAFKAGVFVNDFCPLEAKGYRNLMILKAIKETRNFFAPVVVKNFLEKPLEEYGIREYANVQYLVKRKIHLSKHFLVIINNGGADIYLTNNLTLTPTFHTFDNIKDAAVIDNTLLLNNGSYISFSSVRDDEERDCKWMPKPQCKIRRIAKTSDLANAE